MNGRPLRFIGIALTGWVAARAVMLWPAAGPAALPRALIPVALAESAPSPTTPPTSRTSAALVYSVTARSHRSAPVRQPRLAGFAMRHDDAPQPALLFSSGSGTPQADRSPPTLLAPPPATAAAVPKRWSASAWFVLRDGRGLAPGLSGGQLGGSQTGLRVAYAIDDARRLAIVARVASPLRGTGREAALGLEWRPTKLPVRVVAEYRASLDGGGSGPAAGIIAGTGPAPLALGFDLETYGQAGVIRRRRSEPFAEGAARLSRPVVGIGRAKVDLGLGGWGGAQRGAQRLDVGPSLGIRAPVAGTSLRLSLDWRQRVAGNARPDSGPVLTIGGDF